MISERFVDSIPVRTVLLGLGVNDSNYFLLCNKIFVQPVHTHFDETLTSQRCASVIGAREMLNTFEINNSCLPFLIIELDDVPSYCTASWDCDSRI